VWIHLLRHGIAIDRADPNCPPDPERALTDQGWARTREAMRGFARCRPSIDAVVVSPYVRAQQTADVAVEELGLRKLPRLELGGLKPEGDPDEVLRELGAQGDRDVLLVGHAPNLDRIAARLCGQQALPFALKKAGVAMLRAREFSAGSGNLYAWLTPKLLRAIV